MHIMIDIEAFSKSANACLIQVAAVAFNIETGELSHTFNGVIRNSGGAIDVDTVAWWMCQTHAPVLGAKLQDPSQAGDEREVLEEFCHFFRLCDYPRPGEEGSIEAVWAHGATYDFPILQSALARCGLAVPWHYRAPRDTRTLFAVTPGGMPRPPVDEARKHDALYDCEYQIKQVVEAWYLLRRQAADAAALESMRASKEGWKQRALAAGWADNACGFGPAPAHVDEQGGTHSSPEAAVPALSDEALLQDAAETQALR